MVHVGPTEEMSGFPSDDLRGFFSQSGESEGPLSCPTNKTEKYPGPES